LANPMIESTEVQREIGVVDDLDAEQRAKLDALLESAVGHDKLLGTWLLLSCPGGIWAIVSGLFVFGWRHFVTWSPVAFGIALGIVWIIVMNPLWDRRRRLFEQAFPSGTSQRRAAEAALSRSNHPHASDLRNAVGLKSDKDTRAAAAIAERKEQTRQEKATHLEEKVRQRGERAAEKVVEEQRKQEAREAKSAEAERSAALRKRSQDEGRAAAEAENARIARVREESRMGKKVSPSASSCK
jgi:hypothetical protein